MMKPNELFFDSGGLRCAADLYWPADTTGPVACVVMGHGFSGTRDMGLAPYAERFAAAGMAVLVFDYRHFGASDGQPRQLIDITGQLDDYRAAIRFARSLRGVNPERIALWGTSLSGGHVIAVAAADPHIAAVVAQVPWVGIERSRRNACSTRVTLLLFAAAIRDAIGSLLGRPPYLVPAVGDPTEVAVFSDADARMWRDPPTPSSVTLTANVTVRSSHGKSPCGCRSSLYARVPAGEGGQNGRETRRLAVIPTCSVPAECLLWREGLCTAGDDRFTEVFALCTTVTTRDPVVGRWHQRDRWHECPVMAR